MSYSHERLHRLLQVRKIQHLHFNQDFGAKWKITQRTTKTSIKLTCRCPWPKLWVVTSVHWTPPWRCRWSQWVWEAPCWSLSTLSLTGLMTFSRWERKMVRYATAYHNISGISGYLKVRIRMDCYYPLSTLGISPIHSRQSHSTSFDCSFFVRIPYKYSLLVGGVYSHIHQLTHLLGPAVFNQVMEQDAVGSRDKAVEPGCLRFDLLRDRESGLQLSVYGQMDNHKHILFLGSGKR